MDSAMTSVRAQGVCLLGAGGGAFPFVDLSALFIHVCVCTVCLFSAWLKSFSSLGIQAPPQMAYTGLSPRDGNPEVFILSFSCKINIWNEAFPSLPTKEWESRCVFCSCFVVSKNANDCAKREK